MKEKTLLLQRHLRKKNLLALDKRGGSQFKGTMREVERKGGGKRDNFNKKLSTLVYFQAKNRTATAYLIARKQGRLRR